MPTKSTSHVFEKEVELLNRSQELVSNIDSINRDKYKEEYIKITNSYAQLLEETRLITRVSDRLQNKINRANDKLSTQSEEISIINTQLENKNGVLKNAVEQLVKAKISNKASTIVLIFALILFLLSEVVLEPIVESKVDSVWMGIFFKAMIFALLKPIEMVVEKYLERKSTGKDKIEEELLN